MYGSMRPTWHVIRLVHHDLCQQHVLEHLGKGKGSIYSPSWLGNVIGMSRCMPQVPMLRAATGGQCSLVPGTAMDAAS